MTAPATGDSATPVVAPLVGRDAELERVRQVASEVIQSRRARTLTLVGPNGVGKTRLLDAIAKELATEEGGYRVYRGAPKRALGDGPLRSVLKQRFGLTKGLTPEQAAARVRGQIESVLDDRKVGDVCYFIGQILDLPFQESPLTKALSDDPKQVHGLRRSILRYFLEADAAQAPICYVLDDLDAAGEDGIGFVAYMIEHIAAPVLFLCSTRPEVLASPDGWFDFTDPRHERLELGPLSDGVVREVAGTLLSPCQPAAPEPLVDAAVRLATGNLGLLHATVQIFFDSGVLEHATQRAEAPIWHVNLERLSSVQLPDTIEDSIDMRIASLGRTERRILEHAAAIGHVFWLGPLLALDRLERPTPALWLESSAADLSKLEDALSELEAREFVSRLPQSTFPDDVEYVFNHDGERRKLLALTQEESRRGYHQTIANWLRRAGSASDVRNRASLIAKHLAGAGAMLEAGRWYLTAAEVARETFAAKQAAHFFSEGLALVGGMDALRRIEALHNYGDVLVLLGRTDDAQRVFREMLALAYRYDLPAKGGAAHNRLGRIHRDSGNLTEATQQLEAALGLFTSVGDDRGVAACHDDLGKVLWTRGDYEAALERMKEALEMRKKIGDRRSIALSLHNIGVVWRDHGRPMQAREALEAALTIRREVADPIGVSQTLNSLGKLAQDQGQLEKARALYQQAYDVAQEVGEQNRLAIVLTNLGEIQYRMGDRDGAISVLSQAAELCEEVGDRLHLAQAKRGLAKAYLAKNELKKARSSIKQAVELFGLVRSKAHLASGLRTLGEVTAAGAWGANHEGKAVDYFMRSIALCKEIGNEIEIAKSYRSFSDYVASSAHYRNNDEIQREARKLRRMSDEIFDRQRIGVPG